MAGEQAFEAGLLARAHRGILYVDEVNLLPDHLVDALLDAAASGVARVEREAVSVSHAARFLLVGTMNVEEGELRPQLLDRFGLGVEVRAPRDRVVRAEIVRRRLAFERDPAAFAARFAAEETALRARIADARALLPSVRLPERELLRITGACAELEIDGVRGDIVCARAAQALAALEGASEVEESHVRRAAALALAHRRHRDPLGGSGASPEEDLQRALDAADEPEPEPEPDATPPGAPARPPAVRTVLPAPRLGRGAATVRRRRLRRAGMAAPPRPAEAPTPPSAPPPAHASGAIRRRRRTCRWRRWRSTGAATDRAGAARAAAARASARSTAVPRRRASRDLGGRRHPARPAPGGRGAASSTSTSAPGARRCCCAWSSMRAGRWARGSGWRE